MDAATLRTLIRSQIDAHGLTMSHAAALAGVHKNTVIDYFSGKDTSSEKVLRLAAAVGLSVSATARTGFAPAPPPTRGRKKISRNSAH